MKRVEIDVRAHSAAERDAVFELLADGSTYPSWSPIESFALERPGDPPPEGVGAIRVFRQGRTTGRDEIVELVPGRRLGYVIRWRSSFLPKLPGTGWVLRRGIGRFIERCANGLADHAGREAPK